MEILELFYLITQLHSSLGEVQVSNAFDASIMAINPKLEEEIELKEK